MIFGETQNTKALKERFPEVYRKFFAENDLVISSDFLFNYAVGINWRVGAPAIRQKLPFKSFVGIKASGKKEKIDIGSTLIYFLGTNKFAEAEYETLKWKETLPFLNEFVKKEAGNNFNGITLSFLLEISEEHGFDAAISAEIVAAVYLYFNKIDLETMEQIPDLSATEIIAEKTESSCWFKKIHLNSAKMLSLSLNGCTSGNLGFSALLNSEYPILYFTEEREGSIKKPYLDLPPLFIGDDLDELDKLHYWGFRLNDLADITGRFPLDVISIYPGSSRENWMPSDYVNKSFMPSFDKLRDFIQDTFDNIQITDNKHLPSYFKNLEIDSKYWHDYASGLTYRYLFFLKDFLFLYREKMSTEAINRFIEHMNGFAVMNKPLEEFPSKNLEYIISRIRKTTEESAVPLGVRPYNWGKMDGNILVFAPPKKVREKIFELTEELQKNYDSKIHIDFASWRDGWGKDGIKVEQFVSKGVFSEFIDKNSRQLISWNKTGGLSRTVINDIEEGREKYNLLLDKSSNEIYIKGEKFSSKELPSKKATIEILEFLLNNSQRSIANKQLPESSYAKYRNELQGKIITPLNKLLKEKTGMDLGLRIFGKLRTFYLEFNPKDLKIGLIDKI